MTVQEITNEVLKSKKYSDVDRAVIERISAETIPKFVKQKDIVKAVKKKLHLIYESFLPEECLTKAEIYLENYSGDDIKADKDFSTLVMELHVSTRERLGQAEEIYEYVCRYITSVDTVIDLGCGFNPFALPFFTTLPKRYLAFDISFSTIHVLNRFFRLAGLPYSADKSDAVVFRPDVSGHVLFMFKLFPLLEQQKKGRAFEVLKSSACKTSIVSFPLKSASGKEKGMEAFYSNLFESWLPYGFVIVDKRKFKNELFYVVERDVDIFE